MPRLDETANGVFVIAPTPFREDGALDEASAERMVDAFLEAGASGLTLLGAAALVAIVDPLYYKWLARRRWLYLSYHTLTLFAVLLVALPLIVHLTTAQSYRLALGAALVIALPSLGSSLHIQGLWRWATLAGLIAALGAGAWLTRPWVPPATLWLTQVAVTEQLQERNPGRSLKQVSVAQLQQAGLYAYTAISAPRGLNERIYHVWKLDGVEMDRIALDIHGGRKAGYRAWTHKRNFPAQAAGDWQVQVVTEAGQQIGVLRFRVDPARQAGGGSPAARHAPRTPSASRATVGRALLA